MTVQHLPEHSNDPADRDPSLLEEHIHDNSIEEESELRVPSEEELRKYREAPQQDAERKPLWKRPVAWVAVGTLAGAAIAGGTVYAASDKPDKTASISKETAPAQQPTKNGTVTTPKPTDIPTINNEVPRASFYADDVLGTAAEQGTLNLTVHYPAAPDIILDWNGTQIEVPPLKMPGTTVDGYTFGGQDLGQNVLAQLAALLTLDPSSESFTTLLNSFTSNPNVKQWVVSENQAFQAKAASGYTDQIMFFDTKNQGGVLFSRARTTDKQGNPYLTVGLGTLYFRYLNKDCVFTDDGQCTVQPNGHTSSQAASWQDSRAMIPSQSLPINTAPNGVFSFSYEQAANGDAQVSTIALNIPGF